MSVKRYLFAAATGPLDSIGLPAGSFAIVNASTTQFDHPFAMDLPQDEVAGAHQLLQIRVRRLQFLGSDSRYRTGRYGASVADLQRGERAPIAPRTC